MTKLQQLRERRNAKARAAQELNAKYSADQRMPTDDASKLDAILAEVEAIDAEISREQRTIQLAGDDQPSADDLRNRHTVDPSRQDGRDTNAALRAYLTGGIAGLTPEQRATMSARVNDDIRSAMNPRNAMSTTAAAEGGYTTAPEYQRSLEVALKSYGAIFEAVNTLMTATGTQMSFPTADPTSEEGEIVGQNAAVSGQDTTFGVATLDVYKYSSKKIALPFELVQDTFIDIEAYINDLLAMRLGRIQSRHMTIGTGTGQPRGLVPAATVGFTAPTGQAASITYDSLIELEHSLDPAYRNRAGVAWMMHDNSVKAIRKIKDANARPIFVPGYEVGTPGGAPDTLLGRRILVNQDMAPMAANARSILFGDFKKYNRRVVMDLTMFRMTDSAFTLNGQVGFVAFNRVGGNLIDVGGAVKAFVNSAT